MVKKILFFISIILSFDKINSLAKEDNDDDIATSLLLECNDIEIFYSEKGVIKYKLESPYIEKLEDNSVKLPSGGTLTCYDLKGEVEFTAHANAAHCTADNKIWTFEGDVFLKAKDILLETKKLNWNRDEKLIFTKSYVSIANKDSLLVGEGLSAKQDLSHYEIEKPRGSVAVEQ